MAEPVTTARALEMVLSRIRMDTRTGYVLTAALQRERSIQEPTPTTDPDSHRAALEVVLYHLDGLDTKTSKEVFLMRIQEARRDIRQMLGK